MSDNKKLFNIITHIIDVKKDNIVFDKTIKGFVGKDVEKEKFVLRKYNNGDILVFTELYNSNFYSRNDAFSILGPCFLTIATKSVPGLKSCSCINEETIKILKFIDIWKSETSHNFVLAKNSIKSKII